jgi:O-antigen/teichoic acid export membrane protein
MIEVLVRQVRDRIKYGTKARSTLYYGGSSIICQGLRFLGVLISTAAIAPDQFGKYATAIMLAALCGMVKEFGQNSAFLSSTQSNLAYARFHFLVSLALSLFEVLLLITFATFIPGLSDIRPAIPLLSITAVIDGASRTPGLMAVKKFEFRRMAIIEIAATMTWLLCIALGSVWYPVAMTLIFARMMESLVHAVFLLAWFYRDLFQGEITAEVRRYYGRFARLLAVQAWLELLLENLDVLLLKCFATETELGVYERTQRILRIPLSLSVNLVDRVAAASYSREQMSIPLLQRSLTQFASLIALGTIAGLIAVQLFLWLFAGALIGVEWKNAISSLWIWALPFCAFRPLVWNFNQFFQATSRPRHVLFTLIGMLSLFSITGLILTPPLGARGVFVALDCSYFVIFAAQMLWFGRLMRRPVSPAVHRDL